MRLAEDQTSWKSRSIIRRNFRQAHDEPEVPRKVHPKRKGNKHKCSKNNMGPHTPGPKIKLRSHSWGDRTVEYYESKCLRCTKPLVRESRYVNTRGRRFL